MELEGTSNTETSEHERRLEDRFCISNYPARRNEPIQTPGNTDNVRHEPFQTVDELANDNNSRPNKISTRLSGDDNDCRLETITLVTDQSFPFSGFCQTHDTPNTSICAGESFTSSSIVEITLPNQLKVTDLWEIIESGKLVILAGATFRVVNAQDEGASPLGQTGSIGSFFREIVIASPNGSQATNANPSHNDEVHIPISPLIEMINADVCLKPLSPRTNKLAIACEALSKDAFMGPSNHNWPNLVPISLEGVTAHCRKQLADVESSIKYDSQDRVGIFQQKDTSTPSDKKRLEFAAKAILSAAFAPDVNHDSILLDSLEICTCSECFDDYIDKLRRSRNKFKAFGRDNNLFKGSRHSCVITKDEYIGTDRAEYIPGPWLDPDDGRQRNIWQFFNISPPFTHYSSEELRLGDYLRGKFKAPDSFSLFRKLPTELRVMIYKLALDARIVQVRYDRNLGLAWSMCAPPNLWNMCRESRNAVSNSYQLSFGFGNSPPRILFNFCLDTLYLYLDFDEEELEAYPVNELLEDLKPDDLAKVRSLALRDVAWDFWASELEEEDAEYEDDPSDKILPQISVLPFFKNLNRFTLVHEDVSLHWIQKIGEDNVLVRGAFGAKGVICKPSVGSSSREDSDNADYVEEILARTAMGIPDFSVPRLEYILLCSAEKAEANRAKELKCRQLCEFFEPK